MIDENSIYLKVLEWWLKEGFNYVDDVEVRRFSFLYITKATLKISFDEISFLLNKYTSGVDFKEFIEGFKKKGLDIGQIGDYYYLTATESNVKCLSKIIQSKLPSARIKKVSIDNVTITSNELNMGISEIDIVVYDINDILEIE